MQNVLDYLKNEIKLNDKDVVVVGVSTGPDSMVLLKLLCDLQKELKFKIVVAHVNHNVRIVSAEEALFLENYCHEHNLFFEGMKIEKYGDDNFHNEARSIRYHFFEEIIKKYNANYLMTGHHGDDLMETILMRLVRGSTLRGYSGFSSYIKKDGYSIVRPLIFVTKSDLEEYAKKHNIPYYVDSSNLKDKYTRNRYRHNVLPFLKSEDPMVHEKFLKFSKLLIEYDDFVNTLVASELSNVYQDGMIKIDEFKKLPKLLEERIVENLFAKIYNDDLMLIDDRHINLFFKMVNSQRSNLKYSLPNDYLLIKSYDKIYFKKDIDSINDYDIELSDFVKLPNGMTITKVDSIKSNGNDILRLDSKNILLPLRVRTRKNGDRIETLHGGTKKVKDVFIDKKIPQEKRDRWPIVVDANDKIVWIPMLKKSKYNRLLSDSCDIIFKCY